MKGARVKEEIRKIKLTKPEKTKKNKGLLRWKVTWFGAGENHNRERNPKESLAILKFGVRELICQ